MNLRGNGTAVRMGPITVITLLILIALATLSVLSLTTARAAQTAASKQSGALVALYENESQAQQFLADFDASLSEQRAAGASPEQAASAIAAEPFAQNATLQGSTLGMNFSNDMRKLAVEIEVRSDLTYQITSWKTVSNIDTTEQVVLWQGN